ncbi:MAG: N-formylglutamate deformylase [Lysobacterales bacterium]|jgi:N-formylglutamate deformylase|nr:MAG: N-formylglutamate deformylase [Xanthomonadales bacterium]
MGDDALFTMVHGERPLLVSVPHAGTLIPDWLRERLTAAGRAQRDADFGVPELYREALPAGCSLLTARYSRYLVDLNRAPDDRPLYPGRFETGICPLSSFAGEPLYREGQEPDAAERRERIERYWRPYHEALQSELDRLRQRHRRVLLWDAHSIRGRLPLLFEGELPDLNLGTADGASCGRDLRDALLTVVGRQNQFSYVFDGRFKGGYITRHYGRPAVGVDAVQLELRQGAFLDEEEPHFEAQRARPLIEVVRDLLEHALAMIEED